MFMSRVKLKVISWFSTSPFLPGYESNMSGSCNGDSGGPLIRFYQEGGPFDAKYVQVGIIAGGVAECGSKFFPSIYVRLEDEAVLDFIKMAITKHPGEPPVKLAHDVFVMQFV